MVLLLLFACRLDYPGIGPEHSFLMDSGRAEYHAVTDQEALDVSELLSVPYAYRAAQFCLLQAADCLCLRWLLLHLVGAWLWLP